MAYKFTEKSNNKQQQTAYVLYMIVGSYFHKSICHNKILETSLRLHYREMPEKRQEQLEERVIADTEKELKDILSVLAEMNCNVTIRYKGDEYCLNFTTGFEAVSVTVDRKGHYHMQVRSLTIA